tara:strand:- start:9 stop:302 length:294 start_codon:yes stop_codon:yes gene_type:complete
MAASEGEYWDWDGTLQELEWAKSNIIELMRLHSSEGQFAATRIDQMWRVAGLDDDDILLVRAALIDLIKEGKVQETVPDDEIPRYSLVAAPVEMRQY